MLALTFAMIALATVDVAAVVDPAPAVALVNVALQKPAAQSSIRFSRGPTLAVDGNKDPNAEKGGSCSAMDKSLHPWWRVDLGSAYHLKQVSVSQRNSNKDSMCNFEIKVLMGLENGAASTICATRSGCVPLSKTETLPCDAFGRYVMIRRTSDVVNVGFQLCEVEVFAKLNVALRRPTFQSSVASSCGPTLAVDGNPSSSMENVGSCSVTKKDVIPWWAVDLEAVYNIREVSVSQRDKYVENLAQFMVAVTDVSPSDTSPSDLGASQYSVCATQENAIPASQTKTFVCGSTDIFGRYVFIRSTSTDVALHLCEIGVFAAPGPPGDIVVSARSSSLLAVKWDGPSVRVKEYKVTLEGDSNTHPAQIIKDSKRKAIFNSLIAGTEYTVRVVTLGGDQQSATAQNKFYTSI